MRLESNLINVKRNKSKLILDTHSRQDLSRSKNLSIEYKFIKFKKLKDKDQGGVLANVEVITNLRNTVVDFEHKV